jgi:hypothetical protein
MHKDWKGKKKEKSHERMKGFKHTFNINEPNKNHHDQYAKDDSKK